jgi:hypothetical protein
MGIGRVPENLPPDARIHALIRRIDELLAEAARLRDEVAETVRDRTERPFWPDRRRRREPRQPDRRDR